MNDNTNSYAKGACAIETVSCRSLQTYGFNQNPYTGTSTLIIYIYSNTKQCNSIHNVIFEIVYVDCITD